MELFQIQQELSDELAYSYSTFKKSPTDRRTLAYLKKHIAKLQSTYQQFVNNDAECQKFPEYSTSEYATNQLAATTYTIYKNYREKALEWLRELPSTAANNKNSEDLPSTTNNQTNEGSPTAAASQDSDNSAANNQNSEDLPSTAAANNDSISENQIVPVNLIMEFQNLSTKRKAKIKQLMEQVTKLNAAMDENKSTQFYEQKAKQLEAIWVSVMETTDHMMGSEYQDEHTRELSQAQDNYDDIMIRIREANSSKKCSVKLPQLNLQPFDGSYFYWKAFYDLFEQSIHKSSHSNVEKFQYLKTLVKGEAAQVIQHLQITEDNYATAWDLLKKRYNNERRLVQTYVQRILNQPSLINESANSLKKLHDTTVECVQAIRNLGVNTDGCDFLLNVIIEGKMDPETSKYYEQWIKEPKKVQKLNEMLEFIEERFNQLESTETEQRKNKKSNEKSVFSVNMMTNVKCLKCLQSHLTQNCDEFKKLSARDRYKTVKNSNACINCLHPSHTLNQCKSKHKCNKCGKKHHSLLHNDEWEQKVQNGVNVHFTHGDNETVLIPTALVKCYCINGDVIVMRAMIDKCATASIVTENAAQLLGMPKKQIDVPIRTVGDKITQKSKQFITLKYETNESVPEILYTKAIIMKKISQKLPSSSFETNERWKNVNTLKLADSTYNISSSIDILLGGDVYGDIILKGLRRSKNGSPTALSTKLGWILCGKIQRIKEISCFMINAEEESVNDQLKNFWQIEETNDEQSVQSEADKQCEEFYNQTTIRDINGRYQVKLPFIKTIPILGQSRKIAIAQLLNMEKKFKRDPKLKQQYISNMREYFECGHIVEVDTTEEQHKTIIDGETTYTCSYLPHHAVIKPSSSTTKCRIVFNASRKTNNGRNLNEQLRTGPTMQDDIFEILLRWRIHKYVINGDIARMYRQINVDNTDAEYQRIVWREREDQPIRDYKLTTVTFGTTPAPFLAIRTIRQLIEDEQTNFPVATDKAVCDFYVDDFYSGADTIENASELRKQITEMFARGGFQIRKWISNDEKILNSVAETDRGIRNIIDLEDESSVKALGLQWNPKDDIFTYKTASLATNDLVPTKRQFLSITSRIFDPIGWLSPSTILIKVLFQKLWIAKTQWDENIPHDVDKVYQQYRSEFPLFEKLRIPRWINLMPEHKLQLHGFCDASEAAYAAVIYARIITEDNIHTFLLTAKTKVAPIKRLTIPKLELCGAVLATRLMRKTVRALGVANVECFSWCDSTITLSWIRNKSTKLPTFVANRVNQIHEANLEWRYVPTDLNPADCASRGLIPSQLLSHELWWHGPGFLRATESEWPIDAAGTSNAEIQIFYTNIENEGAHEPSKGIPSILPLHKYSSFSKLQRVTAYCLRFINNCKKRSERVGPLKANEYDSATISIVRAVQHEVYFDEIQNIQKDQPVRGKLTTLNPFLDDNRILRVNGRVGKSNLPYHQKYPMILPKSHHVTILLIQLAHIMMLHGGSTMTLSHLRNKFWIPNGINTVKGCVRACQRCARFNTRTMTQQMAALPEPRVNISKPFTHTGIDYAGPIDIRTSSGRGHKTFKGYIAVFICFATKAIHVEAVSNLTSTGFIAALRRFCGRRGHIKHLYSDNGSNFVGANKILNHLNKQEKHQYHEDICNALAENGIEWHFNPPSAPHFGGLWEAGVKSIKTHIKRLGRTSFTYEEFSTLLIQIEACLNSRPLCPLTDDPNDLNILTPGHFLTGRAMLAPPDETNEDLNTTVLTRWQIIQKQLHEFWSKWSAEYLQRLQQRPKWLAQRKNLTVNDLVLIKEDNLAPSQWLRGRVIKVFPGADELVRVALLKTARGTLKRPIVKLCLLPKIDQPVIQSNTAATSQAKETTTIQPPANNEPRAGKRRSRKIPAPQRSYNLRPRAAFSHVTLMFLFALLAQVFGEPFNITKFNDQPGIYFEQLGNVNFITGEWTILIHYNMSIYSNQHEQHVKDIEEMEKLCKTITFQQIACMTVIHQLSEKAREMDIRDSILKNDQHIQRKKRSPFDFIGTIASEAFGVLDQRYARHYASELEKLKNNDQYLSTLLKQHVSVIQATNQAIHQNEERAEQHFGVIQRNLDSIKRTYKEIGVSMSEQTKHQVFLNIAMHTLISMTRFETIQSNLVDIVTDSAHGKLNPLLFPPEQVKAQISLIRSNLSPELSIPIDDGIAEFYAAMKIRTRTVNNQIIFEAKIPLHNSMKFQLFKIQAMPIPQRGEFIFIKPATEYLIVNLHRDLYYPLRETELLRCVRRDGVRFICKQRHPLFKPSSNLAICELNLLKHLGISPQCAIRREASSSLWSQLTGSNNWLFVANETLTIDIICENQLFSQQLRGAGIIEFNARCIIERPDVVIQSIKPLYTNASISFVPSVNLTEVLRTKNMELKLESIPYAAIDLDNLDEEIKRLERTIHDEPAWDDIHQYAISYTTLIVVIILSIIFYYKIKKSRLIPHLIIPRTPQPSQSEAPECIIQTNE